MLRIPDSTFTEYEAHLRSRNIPPARDVEYRKWLRYYLDFCNKYPVPNSKAERVRLFCDKLMEKRQNDTLRERVVHTVSLYYEMLNNRSTCYSENIPGCDDYFSSPSNLALTDQKDQQTAGSITEMGASSETDGKQGNASTTQAGRLPGQDSEAANEPAGFIIVRLTESTA